MHLSLPVTLSAADAPTQDQRTLLTIPFEDREDILRVMRGNLDQVRQIIEALSRQDYAAIERIADQLSFDRKKADGLARRGNAGYAAMGGYSCTPSARRRCRRPHRRLTRPPRSTRSAMCWPPASPATAVTA